LRGGGEAPENKEIWAGMEWNNKKKNNHGLNPPRIELRYKERWPLGSTARKNTASSYLVEVIRFKLPKVVSTKKLTSTSLICSVYSSF
jgi:hypothetical protein